MAPPKGPVQVGGGRRGTARRADPPTAQQAAALIDVGPACQLALDCFRMHALFRVGAPARWVRRALDDGHLAELMGVERSIAARRRKDLEQALWVEQAFVGGTSQPVQLRSASSGLMVNGYWLTDQAVKYFETRTT